MRVALSRELEYPALVKVDHVYTEDMMRAGRVMGVTIQRWAQAGLLPPGVLVSMGPGGRRYRYPAWALDRARIIGERRREGYTLGEVREFLRSLDEGGGPDAA